MSDASSHCLAWFGYRFTLAVVVKNRVSPKWVALLAMLADPKNHGTVFLCLLFWLWGGAKQGPTQNQVKCDKLRQSLRSRSAHVCPLHITQPSGTV